MSNSSTTYSRDVLLNIRSEVTRVQFISPTIARAAERNLPRACLRDFRYSALRPENRELFLNLSVTSSRIRRLISASKYSQIPLPRSPRLVYSSRSLAPRLAVAMTHASQRERSTLGLLPLPKTAYTRTAYSAPNVSQHFPTEVFNIASPSAVSCAGITTAHTTKKTSGECPCRPAVKPAAAAQAFAKAHLRMMLTLLVARRVTLKLMQIC